MPSVSLSLELTADGLINAISPQLLRLLGFPRYRSSELVGRSMLERSSTLVHPDDRTRFCAAFNEAVEQLSLGASCDSPQAIAPLTPSPLMPPATIARSPSELARVVEGDMEAGSPLLRATRPPPPSSRVDALSLEPSLLPGTPPSPVSPRAPAGFAAPTADFSAGMRALGQN